MSSPSPIIGIDLGTTNSLVAVSDGKGARILLDGESPFIPSVLYYDESGKIQAVGNRAKTLKSVDPKRILYSVKRLMGRGSSDLAEIERELPFDFSGSTEEIIRIQCGKVSYTPIELSAEILKRCKFVAENHLGVKVQRAVITVPAYFNDAQRSATVLAGKLAGLQVVRILNEPTAAALAFGLGNTSEQKTVAVYDFGGGTFDISILKVSGGIFEVLATAGDTHLGGDDLDQVFYDWLCKKIGRRPEQDDDQILLKAQVERAKIALGSMDEIQLKIQWAQSIQWDGKISRTDFDEIIRPVVQKTIQASAEAMTASGLSISQIDEVVLVGGSSRVPLVRKMVKEFFQKEPDASVNPDETVALGAAIQAAILSGEIPDTLLLDVVPLSLGLETLGGVVSKIITRNSTIPAAVSELFTTYADFQTAVDFHIVQGERELAKDCRSLGRFKLKILRAPAGIPKIKVTFMMDADGILRVNAVDQSTGERSTLEVQASFGLTDQEVESMLKDAFENAEQDFQSRQFIEAQTQALALIRATEKSLSNPLLEENFRNLQTEKLQPVIRALTEDLRGSSAQVISARTKELDHLTQELAQHLLSRSIGLAHQPVETVTV